MFIRLEIFYFMVPESFLKNDENSSIRKKKKKEIRIWTKI